MFNSITQSLSPKGYLTLVDSTSSDSEGDVPDHIVDMIPKLEGTHLQVGDLKRWQVQVLPSNAHALLTESEKFLSDCSRGFSIGVGFAFLILAGIFLGQGIFAGVGNCYERNEDDLQYIDIAVDDYKRSFDPETCIPGDWEKAVGLCVGGVLGSLALGALLYYFLNHKYPSMLKTRAIERHQQPNREIQRSLEDYAEEEPVPNEFLVEYFPRFPEHLVKKMHYRQLRACEKNHLSLIFHRLASNWLSKEQSYLWKKVKNIGNITVERLATQFEQDPFFKESLKSHPYLAEAILDHLPESALENQRICKLFSHVDDNEGSGDDDEEIQLTVSEAASSETSTSVDFVNVRFDDFRYSVPKALLTSNSQYFRVLFTGRFHEGQSNEVEIHEWSAAGFEKFVTFCMEGKIDLSDDISLEEALKIADQYNSDTLKNYCEGELLDDCSLENYSSYYGLAQNYNLEKIKTKIEFDCKKLFSTLNPQDDKFSKMTTFLQKHGLINILEDRMISYLSTSFSETLVLYKDLLATVKTLEPILAKLSERTQELYHEQLTVIVSERIKTTDTLKKVWKIACENKSLPLKNAIANLCNNNRDLAEDTWVALPTELATLISMKSLYPY